jgi:hypothetical protein
LSITEPDESQTQGPPVTGTTLPGNQHASEHINGRRQVKVIHIVESRAQAITGYVAEPGTKGRQAVTALFDNSLPENFLSVAKAQELNLSWEETNAKGEGIEMCVTVGEARSCVVSVISKVKLQWWDQSEGPYPPSFPILLNVCESLPIGHGIILGKPFQTRRTYHTQRDSAPEDEGGPSSSQS